MVVELVTTIFLVLICTKKNYIHRTDMNTDADEVEHMTVDVGDVDHQHQWCNHWTVLLDALCRDEHGCG